MLGGQTELDGVGQVPRRRVVITGLGVVSSIGIGVSAYGDGLKRGASGISALRGPNTQGFPFSHGGEVHDFDATRWVRRLDPDTLGRTSQFAIAAAYLAIADADLDPESLGRLGCAVSIGTTDGESLATDLLCQAWASHGPRPLTAQAIRKVPADRLAVSVAHELDLHGDALTIGTACAAGNYALGNAFDMIRSGEADLVLGGGAESMARKSLAGFYRLGAIAPARCQPFDVNRRGIVVGEGAAMLLLETLEGARARGARIYAELLGYGLSCDAGHPVAPDCGSIATCMRRAHHNAGIDPAEVDYVCAHGTGTLVNDAVEARAIREVFGEHVPPTSSLKSMLGHTMGAASALGAVACALALADGFMPPTINSEQPDPECNLDCVPNEARAASLRVVQNNAFAFGGNNAIVVFRRAAG
jgi:3-oxoacyl-[acyl-carrier-protein] synthase II